MKTVLITLVTLITSAALAMPAVGDKALYNVTETQAGTTYQYTFDQVIVSQDPTTHFFNIDQTITYQGQSQVKSVQQDPANLPTDSTVTSYITNCVMIGGKLETITIAAGTFNTCVVLTDSGSTLWIANVPFGIAKSIEKYEDGSEAHIELQSYTHGK